MQKELKIAGYAGIVMLASRFAFIIKGAMNELSPSSEPSILFEIVSPLLYASTVLFLIGFVLIGKLLKNKYLIISSCFLIIGYILPPIYRLVSPEPSIMVGLIWELGVEYIGFITLVFGTNIMKLSDTYGSIATIIGILEIIIGCMLLIPSLEIIVLLVILPSDILQVILLFKVAKKIE
ncbi:MAG: hypothetical protein KAQ92_07130 [Candidatus Aenigmarchaeota archaeon]|nr:hypothetical protein [Candidatus Aenigmarchaeota archaeon]